MKANKIKWLRKELLFIRWLGIFWQKFKHFIGPVTFQLEFYLSLIGFIAIIFYIGYSHDPDTIENFSLFFKTSVWIFMINGISQLVIYFEDYNKRNIIYLKILYLAFIFLFLILNIEIFHHHLLRSLSYSLYLILNIDMVNMLLITLIFVRQFSKKLVQLQHYFVNPAQLFTVSFIFIILFGSLLLLLPHSTKNGISLIDAVFTSTSAVCVTGLTSVDTYACYTELGKIIILFLIQIGGIGVVTFTGFFALFFRGNYSFKDQMMLKDIMNKDHLTGILWFIYYIIFSTLIFEGIGAIVIYISTDAGLFASNYQHWFFSIFHAVSAFCNAGFSNVDQGLCNISFRYNYIIQMVIAILIIFGGMGYTVYLNLQQRIFQRFKNLFRKRNLEDYGKIHYIKMDVNTKLAVITTIILIIGGTLLFLYTEYTGILSSYGLGEKLLISFFSAVTPRTAGFNTYDFGLITNSSCLLIIFLMWIGASPGSTGGGIKTTTFAVAVLNSISLGKGKERLEVFRKEIDVLSIKRAFSVIFMSVLIIFSGSVLVHIIDPELQFRAVIFECFSALGTVGLTLGITPLLSTGSKIVIILLMFVGRIGAITLMTGFIKKLKIHNYRYCSEQILIN